MSPALSRLHPRFEAPCAVVRHGDVVSRDEGLCQARQRPFIEPHEEICRAISGRAIASDDAVDAGATSIYSVFPGK